MTYITDLSDYDLVYIFSFLSATDIITIRKVCKLFADLVYYVRHPVHINYNNYEDIVYGFTRCSLHNPMRLDKLSHCREVRCLFDVDDVCKLNGINSLIVKGKASNNTIVDIPNIEADHFYFNDLNTNFKRLETLTLKSNSNITKIKDLPNLRELKINRLYCDKIINIKRLPSLENLSILGSKLVDKVSDLPNLRSLECYQNQNVDFSTITKLETLCYVSNTLNDINLSIYKFTHLKSLSIKFIRDLDIKTISEIKTLETLKVSHCYLSDVSLLVNIKSLDISHNGITDISMLTNLEVLNMSFTLIRYLPKNNKIHTLKAEDYKFDTITDIDNVEKLYIRSSRIKKLPDNNKIKILDAGWSELCDITNLKEVRHLLINNTKVTEFPYDNNIEELDISFTDIKRLPNNKVKLLNRFK